MNQISTTTNNPILFLEPHILLFRRSLKVSQQVQQQRAAAQQQQYNVLHMK
jgi:hypothetical protein